MENFNQVTVNTNAIPGDRIKHGAAVMEVLLSRDDHVVARDLKTKAKSKMPLQYLVGGTMVLFRREGSTVEIIDATPVKTGSKRVSDKPTKLDACRQIYAEDATKPKSEVLTMFVEIAGCTQQGANTYYCLLKKQAQ